VDYLIVVTLGRLARPNEAETLLDEFLQASPDCCPVAGEDLEAGTIDVTFLAPADTLDEAFARGRRTVAAALRQERDAHDVVGLSLEPVG
jgi:hypothetical protein